MQSCKETAWWSWGYFFFPGNIAAFPVYCGIQNNKLPATRFLLTFTVDHHDCSGHITLGVCLSGSFSLLSFCLLSSLYCTSMLQQKGLSVMWRSDEKRLCLFRGVAYNSRSLGSLGLWGWEGARRTIEPTDRGSVMGGRRARLQQRTTFQFNSTSCFNLRWPVTCGVIDIDSTVWCFSESDRGIVFGGQGSCSQALQQSDACWHRGLNGQFCN